ncbi:MAG: 16S rRNA (uracil(1498)-N(3))-methyltransferase [Rhodoferax sp.]|uniref:16S rRNA (uracil(1498)-N(3))-methyltransferase n=1 Tax=Rhodoferax sp. TaxID=50421 RepID=UPI003267F46E
MPRFYCPTPLALGSTLDLPAGPARHVQVLRMQPGQTITLFNGLGGEFEATIERMGRSDVAVVVATHDPVEREAARAVHLVLGMPANDRMDWLVEKAAELGVASIQPLVTERSVLRLNGERADKKRAHWHAVGVAACEQSGRNRVPEVHAIRSFNDWVAGAEPGLLLSLRTGSQPLLNAVPASGPLYFLSGPEGGLGAAEEDAAIVRGYRPVTLANRVLRSETAPLTALAQLQF